MTEAVEVPVAEAAPPPPAPVEAPPVDPESAPTDSPAPDAPATEKPAEDPRVAARFAELARREAEAVRRERALKAEEAERRAWKEAKELAKKNPAKLLEQHGLTFQDLTQYLLNEGKPPTAEDRIAALEKERAEERAQAEKAKAAAEQAEVQKAIDWFKADVEKNISAASDRFELIVAQGEFGLVHDVIEEHFKATAALAQKGERDAPELLTWEQAAAMVEKHLEDKAAKLVTTKKLASKLAPPAAATTTETPADGKAAPATDDKPASLAQRVKAKKFAQAVTEAVKSDDAAKARETPQNTVSHNLQPKSVRIAEVLAKVRASKG